MGQMIDEDECAVCVEFKDGWIFTYGDLVTLLLCFFILLFSMCKMDANKFKSVGDSFKPLPTASPSMEEGMDSAVEDLAKEMEESELAEETSVNVEERGTVISFSSNAFFLPESSELNEKAKQELERFAKLIYFLPNKIQIEGHTDNISPKQWKTNWELSGARASKVAQFLTTAGVDGQKITVKGFGQYRPRFNNASPEQQLLNNRVDVIIVP
ncbi:OmpA family protein [Deltaproteobacteria bacterium TL4]